MSYLHQQFLPSHLLLTVAGSRLDKFCAVRMLMFAVPFASEGLLLSRKSLISFKGDGGGHLVVKDESTTLVSDLTLDSCCCLLELLTPSNNLLGFELLTLIWPDYSTSASQMETMAYYGEKYDMLRNNKLALGQDHGVLLQLDFTGVATIYISPKEDDKTF